MKQIWNELAGAVVLGLILPAFILSVAVRFAPTMEDAKETKETVFSSGMPKTY